MTSYQAGQVVIAVPKPSLPMKGVEGLELLILPGVLDAVRLDAVEELRTVGHLAPISPKTAGFLRTLPRSAPDDAGDILTALVSFPNPSVAVAVASAFGILSREQYLRLCAECKVAVSDWLRQLARDSTYPEGQAAGLLAISQLSKQVPDELLKLATASPSPVVKLAATAVLREDGRANARARLEKLADDSDLEVRSAARAYLEARGA